MRIKIYKITNPLGLWGNHWQRLKRILTATHNGVPEVASSSGRIFITICGTDLSLKNKYARLELQMPSKQVKRKVIVTDSEMTMLSVLVFIFFILSFKRWPSEPTYNSLKTRRSTTLGLFNFHINIQLMVVELNSNCFYCIFFFSNCPSRIVSHTYPESSWRLRVLDVFDFGLKAFGNTPVLNYLMIRQHDTKQTKQTTTDENKIKMGKIIS